MKADFKFSPGEKIKSPSGFIAPIAICGVTRDGNQYLIRNDYAEEWVAEKDAKKPKGSKPKEDAEVEKPDVETPEDSKPKE